jgi:hypothetical protein
VSGAKKWIRSLASAAISSGAGAMSGAMGGTFARPDVFNTGAGLHDMLTLAAFTAGAGLIIGVANFLKQSPLPPPENETTVTVSQPQGAPPPQVTVTTTEPDPGGPTPG